MTGDLLALADWLLAHRVTHVAMESTGDFWKPVFAILEGTFTVLQERAAVVNRLQKVLEWANIKLAAVATDVVGTSARAMLEAIIDGQSDVAALADLAKGRMRAKRAALEQALAGRVRAHHRFMIARHLEHIDFLDELILQRRVDRSRAAQHPGPRGYPAVEWSRSDTEPRIEGCDSLEPDPSIRPTGLLRMLCGRTLR